MTTAKTHPRDCTHDALAELAHLSTEKMRRFQCAACGAIGYRRKRGFWAQFEPFAVYVDHDSTITDEAHPFIVAMARDVATSKAKRGTEG